MNVKLAETAGFCYGVEQAVNAVYSELERQGAGDGPRGKIYTYGPIVHNDTVTGELAERGVEIISGLPQLAAMAAAGVLAGATVIIRAHGVGLDVMKVLEGAGDCRVIDATCPFVKKIHRCVTEYYTAGEGIIVTGTASHPEVVGILGQIGGDAAVIENVKEAAEMPLDDKKRYCVVSQTTFNMQKFQDIIDILKKRLYDMHIVDTICNATQLRQKEAMSLSRECDAMIVIGGKHSSNTAKLFDICSKECSMTYFIESLQDFTEKLDSSVRCVGITAGASTPKTIIQEVLSYVRDEF